MSCSLSLYVGNSNVIELQGLQNSVTGLADTGATVQVTVKDRDGVVVTGQSWPAFMAHVSAGTYRATLESDIAITAGVKYLAVIDATGSGGEIGHWEADVVAQTRKCT